MIQDIKQGIGIMGQMLGSDREHIVSLSNGLLGIEKATVSSSDSMLGVEQWMKADTQEEYNQNLQKVMGDLAAVGALG